MFFRGIISALSILALVQSGLAEESDADVVFYPVFQLEPIIVGEEGQILERLGLPASGKRLGPMGS